MATYKISDAQKVWRKRAKELKNAAEKSARDAAMFMRNTARGMAPHKTGDLMKGINARPIENGQWEVTSTVNKDFPYQLWVNQTAPFRTVKMVWNNRLPVVYGDGSHTNTGTPRYFYLATLRTQKLFGKVFKRRFGNVVNIG